MSGFSRRGFLKGLAAAGGAALGARLGGNGAWLGDALAADEPTTVVLLHFYGGYNAIWASAAPLQGRFGVTANNFTRLGNGVTMDNVLAATLAPFHREHVATIGVGHGQSSHPGARRAIWTNESRNAAHQLAVALG